MLGTVFIAVLITTLNLLDNLQQNLARIDDDSWKEREAAVLTIGAIAEGCITGIYPHLPQVILITHQRCILSAIEQNSSLLGYGRIDKASVRAHAVRQNHIETIVSDEYFS